MLLYFSSDSNISIFDEEAKTLGIDVKIETEKCLTDYIRRNMNKLNHIEYLAIDLEHIVDEDKEILSTLSAFKVCNSKITIIIVSFERKKGDMLLGNLFAEGIYNFVTSVDEIDREKEIEICLDHTQNNNYANALAFKIDNLEETKEKKKGFLGNILENLKNKNKKEKVYKVKETKLKKEKQPKKQKSTEGEYIPKEPYIEEKDSNGWYDDNFLEETKEKIIEIQQDKSLSQVAREIKSDSYGLINTFKDIEMDIDTNEKEPIFIKLIDGTNVLNYFGNIVGIVEDNTAIIDVDFETEILKNYCKENSLNCIFRENIYDKLANFS